MATYIRPKEQIILRDADETQVERLSQELSITPTLARILVGRGLTEYEQCKKFFNPNLDDLHSPFLFLPMQKSVDRLVKAIESGETIAIHGDYDVDGVTSTSLMMRVLKRLGAKAVYYLPDRLTEGYGISTEGIDTLHKQGASVIITVDCGITAVEPAEYCKKLGIDLIITDHHEPQEPMPDAYAILDHKIASETYPDKNLAGVGMAFKLAQGLCTALKADDAVWKEQLDLASLGSAADIVPLIGENRLITRFGYEQMRAKTNLGLASLIEVQGLTGKPLNTADIVFKLAPAINAAGRLGDPSRGVKLFLSEDEGECKLFATELVRINDERRGYHEKVEREALAWAHKNVDFEQEFATVVAEEGWHQGVIGIVASKLVENFCRPAFLFSIGEDGLAHGSGRSIAGCDLVAALSECDDILESYGGHKVAAGATLKAEHMAEFRRRFNEAIKKQVSYDKLVPIVEGDAEVAIPQLTPKFFNVLKRMEPFGPKNRRPILISRNLSNHTQPRTVGKGGNHLKLSVYAQGSIIDAIGFGFGNRLKEIADATSFTLAYTLSENEFRGKTSLQMMIKGIVIE